MGVDQRSDNTPAVTEERPQASRKRRTSRRGKRKSRSPGRAVGPTTGDGTQTTASASSAAQVDVAEVKKPETAAENDGGAATASTTSRRTSRRTAKSSRAKESAPSRARRAEERTAAAPLPGRNVRGPVQVRADGESGAAGKQPPRERSKAGSTPKGAKGSPKQRVEKADAPERQMLINVSAGDECRIAVLHEGRLEELFIERASTQSHVGNIYKGRVTNIEASIQAVFVDFGLPQNGFLHISDVQPPYFPDHAGGTEDVGRKIPRHNRPPIQKCFRRGQEVIVQVSKDGLGTKGPTLTTYVAIPGRFLVMMPGMNRHGVSRKIEDEAERRSMRDMLEQLDLPSGMGFIMRTAGLDRSKRELMRDLHYLMRLWKTVTQRIKHLPPPAELYQESDLVIRTIRDVYTADFSKIIVDDPATAKKAQEFMQLAMPRSRAVIELHADREPLFHRYGIEEEIEKINMRHVPLPSGGSLVIESTEALVAIDVNSGRFRTSDDPEETALRINLEATGEIARQLRLRDLGGLIVCDFIDLHVDRHKRQVERALRDALKKHKERARILKMSAFGLIEMTRQRQGPSLKRNIYYDCPHCKGSGLVKMPSSVVLDVMRIIQLATHHRQVQKISVTVAADVAFQILNSKRAAINQIEADTGKQVIIHGDAGFTSDQMDYACEDNRGRPVRAVPSLTDAGRATV